MTIFIIKRFFAHDRINIHGFQKRILDYRLVMHKHRRCQTYKHLTRIMATLPLTDRPWGLEKHENAIRDAEIQHR